MAVDMKQVVRRLFEEAYGKGNMDVYEETCDSGYRGHDPLTGDASLDKARENARGYKTAFPDLKPLILASYVDGDCCVTQWRMTGTHQKPLMGIAATGARCTVDGISIARFRGGKIIEDWTQWDALGLMKQLGVTSEQQAAWRSGQESRPHA